MVKKNVQKDKTLTGNNSDDKSYKKNETLVKSFLLGVGITNDTNENILEYIVNFIKNSSKNCYITTPNPEIVVLATKDISLKTIINDAELALCDGIGLVMAGNILNKPFKGRFSGVDMVEKLCDKVSDLPITVGFLGGRGGVAEETVERLQKKHPSLVVSFVGEEWDQKKIQDSRFKIQEKKILNPKSYILNPGVDILFVAYGAPKQEKWMAENINKIPVRVMIGVGGAFDYISGKIPRAPKLIRNLGFEWLFRLIVQPWRLKRQFALIEFIFLVLKQKLANRV